MENVLELRGLYKAYGNRVVLRAVELDLGAGQLVVVTGPNGSGKTTLLQCMAGAMRPTEGTVRWFGASRPDRRRIGLLSDRNGLYGHLTLLENLVFAARMWGLERPREAAAAWLERSGLTACSQWFPREASAGMCRRIAVARSLIHDPKIVLLDEPYAHLDRTASLWLTELLVARQRAGCTVCLATHGAIEVDGTSVRRLRLESGRVAEVGRTEGAAGCRAADRARAA